MVLTIIAIIIAVLALVACIFLVVRISALVAEVERLGWEVKGVETTVYNLQKKVDAQPKETIVAGLEGVKYDPERGTMTVNGNLRVNGWIDAGSINTTED